MKAVARSIFRSLAKPTAWDFPSFLIGTACQPKVADASVGSNSIIGANH
jgi:hypothetical protein